MSSQWPAEATVYTETVVHTAPERYISDAPYQLAIIQAENGERFTVRIASRSPGDRAQVGDKVHFSEARDDVAFYRTIDS